MKQTSPWISPVSSIAIVAIAVAVGCQQTRPVPRVAVPQSYATGGPVKTYEPMRPLRAESPEDRESAVPPPAFDDAPLVTQATPEQAMYVDAYRRVGGPRVAVFVNRTVEGKLVPVDERRVTKGSTFTRESTGAVDVETRKSAGSYDRGSDSSDRFKTDGPARVTESSETYLAPGQYDDAQARAIDYEAIELALADTLAAGGKVTLVSPTMARQRLSDDEVKALQAGRPQALREVAETLDADVLIQVQARPTRQTSQGLGVRILVEAMNTRGGESIARSFVDVPPPLDKPTINRYARFLARKTMVELANSWDARGEAPAAKREDATTRP